MKPRLIILSDLWGQAKADWVQAYVKSLADSFDIQFYDCCELGDIDTSLYTQEALHQQFVNGGIKKASDRLIQLEQGDVHILAFSIGGAIAWKYALQNSRVIGLYCLSSTRLRYETKKPQAPVKLWYGELDSYKPSEAWSKRMKQSFELLFKRDHEMYQHREVAEMVVEHLKRIIVQI